MFSFACPHCAREIRAPDEARGRRARCPGCHQAFVVPDSPSGTTAAPARRTERALTVECPCGERFGVARAAAEQGVICPGCHRTLRLKREQAVTGAEPPAGADGLRLLDESETDDAEAADEAPPDPNLPKCPSCGEPLALGATLCTHCGTDLRTGRRGLTKVRVGVAQEAEEIRPWVNWVSLVLWLAIVPYKTTSQPGRSNWANSALVVLTVIASMVALVMMLGGDERPLRHALWSGETFELGQLVTHLFLHGGLAHLIGNMIFLWAFGSAINRAVGEWKYPSLYFVLGALAGYCGHVLAAAKGADIALIGASGAISALSGMYLVLFPRHDVHMAVWFRLAWFFRPRIKTFPLTGIYVVLFYTAFDVAAVALGWTGDVAHWVHLAGFLWGVLFGLALLLTRVVRSDGYDLLTWIMGDRWQRLHAKD